MSNDLHKLTIDSITTDKLERLEKLTQAIRNEDVGFSRMKEVLISKLFEIVQSETSSVEPGHYIFIGNPGTGKTTCAKFAAKYFYEMGLILESKPIMISATSLIGSYVGQTEQIVHDQLMNARGKLLCIDEVDLLVTFSEKDYFRVSAISEIFSTLFDSDFKKNTSVVFSVYPDSLSKFDEFNPGFRRHLTEIEFPDLTLDESYGILVSKLSSKGFKLNSQTERRCRQAISAMMQSKQFYNGRTIDRFADELIANQRKRCVRENFKLDDMLVKEIQPEDISVIAE